MRAAAVMQRQLDAADIPNCISGSLALNAHWPFREAGDVDFAVRGTLDELEALLVEHSEQYRKIVHRPIDGGYQFSRRCNWTKVPVEFFRSSRYESHEDEVMRRAVTVQTDYGPLRVMSAEDVLTMKLWWFRDQQRPKDSVDIATMLTRAGDIDLDQVRKVAAEQGTTEILEDHETKNAAVLGAANHA